MEQPNRRALPETIGPKGRDFRREISQILAEKCELQKKGKGEDDNWDYILGRITVNNDGYLRAHTFRTNEQKTAAFKALEAEGHKVKYFTDAEDDEGAENGILIPLTLSLKRLLGKFHNGNGPTVAPKKQKPGRKKVKKTSRVEDITSTLMNTIEAVKNLAVIPEGYLVVKDSSLLQTLITGGQVEVLAS